MIEKLLNMIKQDNMFDLAFILAEKHHLKDELLTLLIKNRDISYDMLKSIINEQTCDSIDYLDISYNIRVLLLIDMKIDNIDLSNNKNIKHINLSLNPIQKLDISNLIYLEKLFVNSTKLRNIDLSNNNNLEVLSINDCPIEILDLSNTKIDKLYCNSTNIKILDLSKNNPSTVLFYVKHKAEIIIQKTSKIRLIVNDNTKIIEV